MSTREYFNRQDMESLIDTLDECRRLLAAGKEEEARQTWEEGTSE